MHPHVSHLHTCIRAPPHLGVCTLMDTRTYAPRPPLPGDRGAAPSPARSRDCPHLSELGSSFLLLHTAVGHEVVKHFSCRAEAKRGQRGAWGAQGAGRGGTPHRHLRIPSPGTASSLSRSPRRASLQRPGTVGGEGESRVMREETPQIGPHSVTIHVLTRTPLLKKAPWLPTDGKIFQTPQPYLTTFPTFSLTRRQLYEVEIWVRFVPRLWEETQ